jgi:DNA-binding MarR family transcriptional regulator
MASRSTRSSAAQGAATTGPIVLLTRLARVVHRASPPHLLGVNLKDLAALAYLRDHDGTSQQAMGEGLCIDANYCVLLLNDLEGRGLVERRRDPADRRRHLVAMTSAGARALRAAEAAQETIEDDILRGLDASERAELRRLLERALDAHQSR